MVEISHSELSIVEQCKILNIHRSGLYYKPCGESEYNLHVMLEIDKLHLIRPYYGVRRITVELQNMGYNVGRKLVRRLMRVMGIETMYPKPKTTQKEEGHKIYPYLLRGINITRPNQVWQADITYVPMKRGYMYMIAIIDVYSRYVVGWSISNSMEAEWCVGAVEEAIAKHSKPEIFNTDQGSQFTSELFTGMLTRHEIKISMDGKGRAIDNIFIERLWRSVKQENIYINAYETGLDLYRGMQEYFQDYNHVRIHQSLDYAIPAQLYKPAA